MLKRIDKEDNGYILGKTVRKILDTPLLTRDKVAIRTSDTELFNKVFCNLKDDGLYTSAANLEDSILCFNAVKVAYSIGFVNGGRFYRDFIWDKLAHVLNRNYYKKLRKKQREAEELLKECGAHELSLSAGQAYYIFTK